MLRPQPKRYAGGLSCFLYVCWFPSGASTRSSGLKLTENWIDEAVVDQAEFTRETSLHCNCWTERRRKDDVCRRVPAIAGRGRPFRQCGLDRKRLGTVETGAGAHRGGPSILKRDDRLAQRQVDFAFESTLSGMGHLVRLKKWKTAGYRIEVYLALSSPRIAVRRIAARVRQGGHGVPKADVLRRFQRSLRNFR